jgi:hypothetical protein
MARRDIRLDKDSNHPFGGESICFATKHSKEKVLAPLIVPLGMKLFCADVDTDRFGTFSGQINRPGSVRETLRLKTAAAAEINPLARFFLASEGSFGPHPFHGLIQSDHEALLFVDQKFKTEIYVEELSMETNHNAIEFSPGDDLDSFLNRIGFPDHGVIVKPFGPDKTVFKDISTMSALGQAIIDALLVSAEPKVSLCTDMRAHFNPTRMKVIKKAGEKLIDALNSFCPKCHYPGFSIIRGIPGLPCEECGEPSRISKDVLCKCVSCDFSVQSPRPDILKNITAADCEFCNP